MPGFSLPSYAKINWTLRILGKRRDGYHDLVTVFQTVSLHDTLTFEESDRLELTCDDPSIPVDGRNLIMKAAATLKARFNVLTGAKIHLEKRIPSPGGLGGGSSNGAVALVGLARMWGLEQAADLHTIAEELGSDSPFFLFGGTAIGISRGEVVEPMADISAAYMLIVTPEVSVSTRDAYSKLRAITLTSDEQNHTLTVCRTEAGRLDPLRSVLTNDFEASVFAAYPEIARVKETLVGLGAANAAMSGSGASVFAIFDKQETRQAALNAIDHESSWVRSAVATISRSEYREALLIKA